jgi:hypothetical protein
MATAAQVRVKSPAERLAEKLPPDGARELDARIGAAREDAKAKRQDQSFDVRFTVDELGRVSLDVPRRFPWREVG